MWYWIDTGYACFGIEEQTGIVVKTAPIAKWAIRKDIGFVLDYFRNKKKAKIVELKGE
jgi:hypothetical protein